MTELSVGPVDGSAKESQAGQTILRIDASGRHTGSVSRELSDYLVERLTEKQAGSKVLNRDLLDTNLPHVNEELIGAYFTPADDRSDAQKVVIAPSENLVAELKAADVVVIGAPIYNFSVPAALKAWIDLIGRAGETFRYTENGPVGLLEGKKAYIVVASGGTPVDSDIDFMTPYLRHVLGFVGITDVDVIAADRVMAQGDKAKSDAIAKIDALVAA